MNTNDSHKVLVLGCGNDLRGDDAVGRLVADAIEKLDIDGVRVMSVGQYTPDLAADLAEFDLAIFVDACEEVVPTGVRVREILPDTPNAGNTHHADPSQLLGMAKWLFGSAPAAFAVDIPAVEFEFIEALSPIASRGYEDALVEVKRLMAAV
ncbi:MAG TPA: hydrogenase maturation protease [Capsulimonadaceae bacterium]|jgi:hydrogenase maturation protease